jgi:cyclopropane-fatty-acyl-phospholipid synthase
MLEHAAMTNFSASQPPQEAASGPDRRATAEGWLSRLERWSMQRLLAAVGDPPLSVQLHGAWEVSGSKAGNRLRVRLRDRATLWKLLWDPLYQFGEAYADGRLDVEGDLFDLLTCLYTPPAGRASRLAHLRRWWHRPRGNSLARSRENIHHHYDLGNDFYALWLDDQLVYTCAYFPDPRMSLEEAQVAKLEHVCRKLRLRPGERVVEAGCGWGALALHMARRYGVTVKAYNISHEQIVYARQRARREGLASQVEFIEEDWRAIRDPCEAFVSVGMLEHVGASHYRELGAVIDRCLVPEGRGLIHTIGQIHPLPINPWIERRIFPGAYPPTLAQIAQMLEPFDFAVLDVENLRLHYALTLRHWRERFEQAAEAIRQRLGERFVRMWRLYLCGSRAAFQCGSLHLFQVVFARSTSNAIPWTRAYLYRPEEEASLPQAAPGQAWPPLAGAQQPVPEHRGEAADSARSAALPW